MTARQSMSPKLRFEVFKRDKFTCQYCGADLDDMELRAKKIRTLEDFEGPYDAWLESIGRPF